MGKAHYTDDTAALCWLCDRERGELCHVHDPEMRRFLPHHETDDQHVDLTWSVVESRSE